MIRYTKDNLCTVLYWWGGINREILPKAVSYLVFVSGLYFARVAGYFDISQFSSEDTFQATIKGILSFLVFLLVFRLNQCMSRHYAAVALVTDLFHGLEKLTVDLCIHLKGVAGGTDPESAGAASHHEPHHGGAPSSHHPTAPPLAPGACAGMAAASKVNGIRLILAYGISMILHFQLLDATHDSNGILEEMELENVIFLYCRLRCLLYDEEMHLIDQSLSLVKDEEEGETVYRTEVNRFRHVVGSEQLIGHLEKDRDPRGVTVCPAPKIIMNMLLKALQKPSDKAWGYESRLWNFFWRDTLGIINVSLHLESIIQSPTPLPYLQHCRMLFMLFSMSFPASVDCANGFLYNVTVPLVIFWAIMGFEVLSASLENPLGNDEVDMNLYEKIHSLEVNAEQIFNVTEYYQPNLNRALERTENLILGEEVASDIRDQDPANYHLKEADEHKKHFRSFFQWMPLPTLILKDLLGAHGEVEDIHRLRLSWRYFFSGSSIRNMLRNTLRRKERHTMPDRKQYLKVETEEPQEEPIVDFNKDATYFCHYLAFVGAEFHPDGSASANCGDLDRMWAKRAVDLLSDHSAARLLKLVDDEDTSRSMLLGNQPCSRTDTPGGHCWERLA